MQHFCAIGMICRFSSYFLLVCTGCTLALTTNFEIQADELNDAVILSHIISNYIRQFLSNESIFISLVHVSSNGNLSRFHDELITNLFFHSNLTDFSYTSGKALIDRHRRWRQAFNIILINDTISLRQVFLKLNH